MDKIELKQRTKVFGLRSIRLVRALPRDLPAEVVGKQFMRSALSVGANYRSACRARSRADFLSKLNIVLEEADESGFWLEVIVEDGMLPLAKVESLLQEANELTAIFCAAVTSTRKSTPSKPERRPRSNS